MLQLICNYGVGCIKLIFIFSVWNLGTNFDTAATICTRNSTSPTCVFEKTIIGATSQDIDWVWQNDGNYISINNNANDRKNVNLNNKSESTLQ